MVQDVLTSVIVRIEVEQPAKHGSARKISAEHVAFLKRKIVFQDSQMLNPLRLPSRHGSHPRGQHKNRKNIPPGARLNPMGYERRTPEKHTTCDGPCDAIPDRYLSGPRKPEHSATLPGYVAEEELQHELPTPMATIRRIVLAEKLHVPVRVDILVVAPMTKAIRFRDGEHRMGNEIEGFPVIDAGEVIVPQLVTIVDQPGVEITPDCNDREQSEPWGLPPK